MAQKKKIDPEHRLPCDFIVGPLRFHKGVKLETVRAAAERWFNQAAKAAAIPSYKIEWLISQIGEHNRHPKT